MGPDSPSQRVMGPKLIRDNGPPLVPTSGDRDGRNGRAGGLRRWPDVTGESPRFRGGRKTRPRRQGKRPTTSG
jgi:hypothetical protein